jgi:hypothetical protein
MLHTEGWDFGDYLHKMSGRHAAQQDKVIIETMCRNTRHEIGTDIILAVVQRKRKDHSLKHQPENWDPIYA